MDSKHQRTVTFSAPHLVWAILLAFILAAFSLAIAAPAGAQDEGPPPARDYTTCGHFESQADAQAALDAGNLEHPEFLDGDGDGIACEEAFGEPDPNSPPPVIDHVSCGGFQTQADAQEVLDYGDLDNPGVLDADGDGIACEDVFGEPHGGPTVVDPVSCGGFQTQADAQEVLDFGNLERPEVLDPDGDGIACEFAFGDSDSGVNETSASTVTVSKLPKTGSGPAQDSAAGDMIVFFTALGLVSAATLAVRNRPTR